MSYSSPAAPASQILTERLGLKHIPALDGIRAVSVFLVILYHFGFEQVPGSHGVLIFFVLSGFLITWLLLGEQDRTGGISLSGFYQRRALRILPAFFAYTVFAVLLLLVTKNQVPWGHAASAGLFVSNYYAIFNGNPTNAFSHTWSLAIEEQFYLIWPALFICFGRNPARLTMIIIAAVLAVWVYRPVACLAFNASPSYCYRAFETRCDHLLVGCLAAVLVKRGVLPGLWNALCGHAAAPLLTLGLLLASIFAGPAAFSRYNDCVGFIVDPVLIAVLILQLVTLSGTAAWRWLDTAPMRYLGRISYPLYLYQQVTIYPAKKALHSMPVVVQLFGAVAVTVIAASCSYYLVEKPFLRLKGRLKRTRSVVTQN